MREMPAPWKLFIFLPLSHALVSERLGAWYGRVHSPSGLLVKASVLWLGCNGYKPGPNTSFYVT